MFDRFFTMNGRGNDSLSRFPLLKFFQLFLSFGTVRDRYRHNGSASFAGDCCHTPAAHHFKPLPNVFKCGMGFALIGGIEARTGIFHGDLGDGTSASTLDSR